MVKAIRLREVGGPEVMRLEDVPLDAPGPGMVTVRNRAIGLNFIDTYHRSVGESVDLAPGDRVAYCAAGLGAYAEALNLPADRLVRIPEGLDFNTAAAVALKGATCEYLIQRTYPLSEGEYCLFHAAAGGVGLIFGQWARAIGARAIGTVSSPAKAELALSHGYEHVIDYSKEDVVERVHAITGGARVPVVYDGVGRDTFEASLDCLRPRGLLVSFGNASGPPPPLDLQTLSAKGSLFITRPTLFSYVMDTGEMRQCLDDVFTRVLGGDIAVEINQQYPLAEVQQAHRDLEERKTTGSTILLP